jgi:hypothetical protein
MEEVRPRRKITGIREQPLTLEHVTPPEDIPPVLCVPVSDIYSIGNE